MKKILQYISVAFFGCLTSVQSEKKDNKNSVSNIVQDTNKLIEIQSPEVEMLTYLTTHFNKIKDTTFIEKPT